MENAGVEDILKMKTIRTEEGYSITAEGTMTVGDQVITVNYSDGDITYHSNVTGGDYHSLDELMQAEY